MAITQTVHVNADNKGVTPVVYMVQGDTGRILKCVADDFTFNGSEGVSLLCMRPDRTYYSYAGTVNSTENAATFNLNVEGGALTYNGVIAAQVLVSSQGVVVTTFRINIIVEPVLGGEATLEDITFLDSLQAQLNEWISNAEGMFVPVQLTQAEYDALPASKLTDGKVYFITDRGFPLDASSLPYDNSQSGLTASDVQDAIDEVYAKEQSDLSDVQTDLADVQTDIDGIQDAVDALNEFASGRPIYTFAVTEAIGDVLVASILNANNSVIAGVNKVSIVTITSSVGSQSVALLVHTMTVNYGRAKAIGYTVASEFRLEQGTWYSENNYITGTQNGLTFSARRLGNVVQFDIYAGSTTAQMAAGYTITYLPVGFRPLIFAEGIAPATQTRINIAASNGAVTVQNTVSANVSVRASLTFLTGASVYTG